MNKTPSYYEILGLSPETATDEAVRRVYRTLAYRWHPDRNPQNRAAAGNALRMLNEAYMHLKTAPQRRAYDRIIKVVSMQKQSPPSLILPPSRRAGDHQKMGGRLGGRRKPSRVGIILSNVKEILYPIAPKQTEARRHG